MNIHADTHPPRLTIDYPDHELDRLSTLLRAVYVTPIAVVLGLIGGTASGGASVGAVQRVFDRVFYCRLPVATPEAVAVEGASFGMGEVRP